MKKLAAVVTICIALSACEKKNEFNPAGGDLPTEYITARVTGIDPQILNIVMGQSVTFLNQDTRLHAFKSYDTTTIITGPIPSHSYYVFKKDTLGTFPYKCTEHPEETGVIIIQ